MTSHEFISMLKTTSLVYVVAGHDPMINASQTDKENDLIMELLIVASISCLVMTAIATVRQSCRQSCRQFSWPGRDKDVAMNVCKATTIIDFQNGSIFKLSPADPQQLGSAVLPILVANEQIVSAYRAVRDSVVFTNKRLIAINVQGITGKKTDYTSLPYSKIQAFSIETAGTFDLDSELELWFSGLGRVRLEFKGRVDIRHLGQLIAGYVL